MQASTIAIIIGCSILGIILLFLITVAIVIGKFKKECEILEIEDAEEKLREEKQNEQK